MEGIDTVEFFKTVEVDGEQQEVLDYTMRYTYDVTTVMVDVPQEDGTTIQQPQEVETLVKTEKVMNDADSTTYLITEQSGCICVMQTYPVVAVEPPQPTESEILQQQIVDLKSQLELTQAALDFLIMI